MNMQEHTNCLAIYLGVNICNYELIRLFPRKLRNLSSFSVKFNIVRHILPLVHKSVLFLTSVAHPCHILYFTLTSYKSVLSY